MAGRLRAQQKKCTTVQVALRDPDFCDRSKQKKLPCATNLAAEISQAAMELIETFWEPGKPVRLISVTAAQLREETETQQLTFWEETEGKKRTQREKLERAMDTIRVRYGKDSVCYGSSIGEELAEKKPQEEILLPENQNDMRQ